MSSMLKEFIKACAHVYAVMATIFNPDTVIVGGGVPEMADFPKEEFENEVKRCDVLWIRLFVFPGVRRKRSDRGSRFCQDEITRKELSNGIVK